LAVSPANKTDRFAEGFGGVNASEPLLEPSKGGFVRVLRYGNWRRFMGVMPFLLYLGVFLLIPALSVVVDAFRADNGSFTLSNFSVGFSGVYFESFKNSIQLSFFSAVIATIVGLLVALAIVASPGRTLRAVVTAGSGVFANTGGVPLAFSFIATLGNFGLVTELMTNIGFNPYNHGFSLYSVLGLTVVYEYFLIPLMVLIMIPPIDALRKEWVDAASSLGASRVQFWRYVGGPLLAPPLLAGFLVLFTDAFAAYATAAALTSGTIPIVPIQIGSLISGNVLVGHAHLGNALGAGMIGVVLVAALMYGLVQRRASRWLR
jgi:putative spermidine/putrescine transport system permease protein